MSLIKKARVECRCGEQNHLEVVSLLNISSHARYWPYIYSGELNSVVCKKCSTRIYWPSPFVFYDMERELLLNVLMMPFKSGEYMISHTLDFIKNADSIMLSHQLPELEGYHAGCLFNLEDLKSKIHAKMAGFDVAEMQFMEYALEKSNPCETCNNLSLKMLFEHSDKSTITFRTICMHCMKISLVEYPVENYQKVLKSSKIFGNVENMGKIVLNR